MKRMILALSSIIIIIVGGLVACQDNLAGKTKVVEEPVSQDSLIRRGSYLVTAMVCDDCHSPKRMGAKGPEIIPELRLSGFTQNNKLPEFDSVQVNKGLVMFNSDLTAAAGGWGVSFSANITSDATGIGNWKIEQFKKAIREGKWKGLDGNRTLLPPMPWPNFRHASDDDLEAIFAFLKSTRPVKNVVPAPKLLSELR